jgi:hypothetical protein
MMKQTVITPRTPRGYRRRHEEEHHDDGDPPEDGLDDLPVDADEREGKRREDDGGAGVGQARMAIDPGPEAAEAVHDTSIAEEKDFLILSRAEPVLRREWENLPSDGPANRSDGRCHRSAHDVKWCQGPSGRGRVG